LRFPGSYKRTGDGWRVRTVGVNVEYRELFSRQPTTALMVPPLNNSVLIEMFPHPPSVLPLRLAPDPALHVQGRPVRTAGEATVAQSCIPGCWSATGGLPLIRGMAAGREGLTSSGLRGRRPRQIVCRTVRQYLGGSRLFRLPDSRKSDSDAECNSFGCCLAGNSPFSRAAVRSSSCSLCSSI
jgi:hypothetical protein